MPWVGFLKCLDIYTQIRVFTPLLPRFVFTPSIAFNSIHIPLHTLVITAPLLQHIKTIHWSLLSNMKPAASSTAMLTVTRQSNTCINQRQELSDESDITLVSKGVLSQRGVVWGVRNGVALGQHVLLITLLQLYLHTWVLQREGFSIHNSALLPTSFTHSLRKQTFAAQNTLKN